MPPTSIGHQTALDLLLTCCPVDGLVVDAGAFPGSMTRLLKEHGWSVIALDKDPARDVTLPQQFISGAKPNGVGEPTFAEAMREIGVEVRPVDLETSPFPVESQTVDAVVLTEVIEHLWIDPLFALAEMNRILKCGTGVLLLSTPNLLSIRNRINFLRGRMNRVIEHPFVAFLKKSRLGHVGHVRLYSPSELETMLRLLGFEPRFHFYSFDYWEAHTADRSPPSERPPQPGRFAVRKLFRSPRGYWDAGVATLRTCLERIVPSYRPYMFVLARKVRRVEYRDVLTTEPSSVMQPV